MGGDGTASYIHTTCGRNRHDAAGVCVEMSIGLAHHLWRGAGCRAHVGFAKITRDTTERRETQEKLEKTREGLLPVAKAGATGQLTGGVARDFNNLLMVVLGRLASRSSTLPRKRQSRSRNGCQRGGPGRPPLGEAAMEEMLNIRFPSALLRKIEALQAARLNQPTKSNLIRELVVLGIEVLEGARKKP